MLQNDTEAQDAVQEIMYKLWKNKNKLKDHPNYSGFVFLTARNHCLDRLKSRKNQEELDYNFEYNHASNKDEMENKESYELVRKLIKDLPEKLKTAVVLRDIDGLEFCEMETLTGESIENLRVHLSRARKAIAKRITEIYDYEYGKA